MSDEYRSLLTMSQEIFGKEVLPTLEVDAHGLLLDCSFVGLPGQVAFFQDRGNLSGFEPKMSGRPGSGGRLGIRQGFRSGFDPARLGLPADRRDGGGEPMWSRSRRARSRSARADCFPAAMSWMTARLSASRSNSSPINRTSPRIATEPNSTAPFNPPRRSAMRWS